MDQCTRKMMLQEQAAQNASIDENNTSRLSHHNSNINHRCVTPSYTDRNLARSHLESHYKKAKAPHKRSPKEDIVRHAHRSKNYDMPQPRCRKSLFGQRGSAQINSRENETKHQIACAHSVSPLNMKPVEEVVDDELCMRMTDMTSRPLICLPIITRNSERQLVYSARIKSENSSSDVSDDGYNSHGSSDNGDSISTVPSVEAATEEDSEAEYDQPRLLPENYVAPRRQRRLPFRRTSTGSCVRARKRLVFDEESDRLQLSMKQRKLLAKSNDVSPTYPVAECDKRQARRRLFVGDECLFKEKADYGLAQQFRHLSLSRNDQLSSNVSDPAKPFRVNDTSPQCKLVNGSTSDSSQNNESFSPSRHNHDSSSECSHNNDSAYECGHNNDSACECSHNNDSAYECSHNNDSAYECSHSGHSSSPSSLSNVSSGEYSHNNDSAFELSHKVSPTSPCSHKISPSPCIHKVSPTSPCSHKVSPTSPCIHKVSPTGPCIHKVSPTSPCIQKVSPTSPCIHKVSPTGPCIHKVSPTSPCIHKVSPTSPCSHKISPNPYNHIDDPSCQYKSYSSTKSSDSNGSSSPELTAPVNAPIITFHP